MSPSSQIPATQPHPSSSSSPKMAERLKNGISCPALGSLLYTQGGGFYIALPCFSEACAEHKCS